MTNQTTRSPATLWLLSGIVLAAAVAGTIGALHLLVGQPRQVGLLAICALAAVPVGVVCGRVAQLRGIAERAWRASIVVAGLAVMVLAVYLVVVIGFGGSPKGHEKDVLALSMVAAVIAVVLAEPVRVRLLEVAGRWAGESTRSGTVALETFGTRMTRSVPMDELLLQLAETLRASIAPAGAEIWTGADGQLELAVAVPDRKRPRIALGDEARNVAARSRVAGNAWIEVWMRELLLDREQLTMRVAPIAHLGDLLGILVVSREPSDVGFTGDDDRVLSDLARQVGLALHNVRLDSALQASLEELQERNVELQASRARIVAAADASRRAIERNLHDGAQQHLVALAVKLGLAGQIAGDAKPEVVALLEELRNDVQTTIGELRELAHGIYPPLLRDRGLPEALRTAAGRSPLPVEVEAELPTRYPADAEAAAYFCCLEALQNAGKYAGDDAAVMIRVMPESPGLVFTVTDDGPGFDPQQTEFGHGFTNMLDRLGAIGGTLTVESAPGKGTTVRGVVPCAPID